MKAEHRHELKTNELAQWLANFPTWFKQNLRTIIYISIVSAIVIAVFGYNWYAKNVRLVQEKVNLTNLTSQIPLIKLQITRGAQEGNDYSYLLIRTAEELRTLARNTKDQKMAALALIKRAEILRAEPHYRLEIPETAEIKSQINRSKRVYTDALQKAESFPALKAKATFGLGLCEEELGNFEKAKQIYRNITEQKEFQPTSAASLAEVRLKTMDSHRKKLVFQSRPAPEPPTEPNMGLPEIEMLTPDFNSTPQ